MGFLDRFRQSSAPSRAGVAPGREPLSDYIKELARDRVASGFAERDELTESLLDLVEDEGSTAEELHVFLDQLWAERLEEQKGWSGESDWERFEAAFAELESSGIATRMDFSCCGSCAPGELVDDLPEPNQIRGYTYFHQQDTDRIPGGDLMLGYGALEGFRRGDPWDDDAYEQAAVAIGHEIVSVMEGHGLTLEWSGDLNRRILVKVPEWRKPLVG